MKFLLSFGFLIAVTATPVPDLSNELLIQQESEQSEVDQGNAFLILKSIANDLEAQPGKFDEQEVNDDTLKILNTIREILINEANNGDDSDNIKVQQISTNNGLEHISKELQEHLNEALLESENNDPLLTPENVLRSENNLNNGVGSANRNINLAQTDDQYELKFAGFAPDIEYSKSDSDESSDSQSEKNSESIEKTNPPTDHIKTLFDTQFLRIPQVLPVEL